MAYPKVLAFSLFALCLALRPESGLWRPGRLDDHLPALAASLSEFHQLVADKSDATGSEWADAIDAASQSMQDETVLQGMLSGDDTGLTDSIKKALQDVMQVINETMIPKFDEVHDREQELLDDANAEVEKCNTVITTRLADANDIAGLKSEAEQFRDKQETLASQLEDLRSRNSSSHTKLIALMTAIQTPSHCNKFPSQPIPDLWTKYFEEEEANHATAMIQRSELADKISEHQNASNLLDETTEKHTKNTGALEAAFCDWKGQLVTACDSHDKCYETSLPLLIGMQERFADARDKRIEAYKLGLQLIDKINTLMDTGAEPAQDDSQDRFVLTGLSKPPEKAACALSDLDSWRDAGIACANSGPAPLVTLATEGFEHMNKQCASSAGRLEKVEYRGWCAAFDTRVGVSREGPGPRGISFKCGGRGIEMKVGLQWAGPDARSSDPSTWDNSTKSNFKVILDDVITKNDCAGGYCGQNMPYYGFDTGVHCMRSMAFVLHGHSTRDRLLGVHEDSVFSLVVDGSYFKVYVDGQLRASKYGIDGSRVDKSMQGPFWVVAAVAQMQDAVYDMHYISAPGVEWQAPAPEEPQVEKPQVASGPFQVFDFRVQGSQHPSRQICLKWFRFRDGEQTWYPTRVEWSGFRQVSNPRPEVWANGRREHVCVIMVSGENFIRLHMPEPISPTAFAFGALPSCNENPLQWTVLGVRDGKDEVIGEYKRECDSLMSTRSSDGEYSFDISIEWPPAGPR